MADSENRITQLQAAMQAAQVDLLAVGPTANMRYLLEYAPHPDERLCLLLISPETVEMVVPTLNAEDVAAHTDLNLEQWPDAEGPLQALNRAVSGRSVTRLAIDGTMRADFLLPLMAATTPEETITVESLLAPLRARKSPEEIEALALAADQAGRAMQAAMDACQPGVTEAQVAWAAEAAFRKDGAEVVQFTLIASGPNGAFPHHHSGSRRLQQGDAIIIDIGATLNGYQSDITRMVCLGDPPAAIRKAYEAVLAANERGRAAAKTGGPG